MASPVERKQTTLELFRALHGSAALGAVVVQTLESGSPHGVRATLDGEVGAREDSAYTKLRRDNMCGTYNYVTG